MWKLMKKFMCKMSICCKSKCSYNDTNGDGIPDEIKIEQEFIEELKSIIK